MTPSTPQTDRQPAKRAFVAPKLERLAKLPEITFYTGNSGFPGGE